MPATPEPTPGRLAVYLRRAARARGYDLDQPRSGALKQLAADSGIPQSTLSRTLAGEIMPKVTTFQPLADTLHVPVTDMLVEAGLIAPPAQARVSADLGPHTPEDAAIALRIPPEDRPLFIALVRRLTT